VSKLIN